MRRTLSALLVAGVAAVSLGALAPAANAVCDGDPCSDCGGTVTVLKKEIRLWEC